MTAVEPRIITREATVSAVGAVVSGALAKGFPVDVPLWPGSKITMSAVTTTPQGESWLATLLTNDDYEPVLKGMAAGLQNAGWTVESQDVGTPTDPSSMLTISRAEAEGLVTVSSDTERRTTIEIVVTPKR